ncbi:MAG: carboxypeptidase-like regulatory domain-containing protein, partial [Paludibacter sp.]|nr:carboxypeptidase-like regulatory domain-containing protein [Paludibacter sp.]
MKSKKNYIFSIRHLMLIFLAMMTTMLVAQTKIVSGVVTSSEDGVPLIGVNVIVKGTRTGTVTNLDGIYKIEVPQENQVLIFSMVGMKTTELNLRNRTSFDVVLDPDTRMLEQVIVTGYSTQRKADLTGAISVVDVGEIMKQPENNPVRSEERRV